MCTFGSTFENYMITDDFFIVDLDDMDVMLDVMLGIQWIKIIDIQDGWARR